MLLREIHIGGNELRYYKEAAFGVYSGDRYQRKIK